MKLEEIEIYPTYNVETAQISYTKSNLHYRKYFPILVEVAMAAAALRKYYQEGPMAQVPLEWVDLEFFLDILEIEE